MSESPVIVNPQGQPARAKAPELCPQCRKGKEHRKVIETFGGAQTICHCGYEFREGE